MCAADNPHDGVADPFAPTYRHQIKPFYEADGDLILSSGGRVYYPDDAREESRRLLDQALNGRGDLTDFDLRQLRDLVMATRAAEANRKAA